MSKDTYKFRLKSETGAYFFMTGDVLSSGFDPYDLPESVASWNDMSLIWERHGINRGIFKKYAPTTFIFVNEGARILRQVFNGLGNGEAKAFLEILQLNHTTQLYEDLDTFQIDFSKHISKELYAEETLMQGGVAQQITNYEDAEFAIELLPPDLDSDNRWILMDGILLYGRYTFDVIKNSAMAILGGDGLTPPLVYRNQEGTLPFGVPNPNMLPYTEWTGGDFGSAFQFKVMEAYENAISMQFNYTIALIDPAVTHVQVYVNFRGKAIDGVPSIADVFVGDLNIAGGAGSSDTFIGSIPYGSYALEGDNYILLYFRCISSGGGVTLTFGENGGKFLVLYRHRFLSSDTIATSHFGLFKKLIGKIAPGTPVSSELLTTDVFPDDSVWSLSPLRTWFTCGDALRNYPNAAAIVSGDTPPAIITNLKDFTQDGLATNCAGIGLEKISGTDTVVFEKLQHFFDADTLIIDLGDNISNFRMKLYDEYRASSIRAGYKDITINDTNGKYEFAGATNYKSTSIQSQKEVDYTGPYCASCYAAEFMRINLDAKNTTGNDRDNTVFKLQSTNEVEPFGDALLLDRNHLVSAGMPADVAETIFNVPMSPTRNMYRLTPLLASCYYGIIYYTLSHISATKNSSFSASMYGGSEVAENADVIAITDDASLIHKPFVFMFDTPARVNMKAAIENTPYGVIRLTVVRGSKRAVLEGHIEQVQMNPGAERAFEFTLLCSRNTTIPVWL